MTAVTPLDPISPPQTTVDETRRVRELLAARSAPNEAFFGANAERIARLCERMAGRFLDGGRLIGIGCTPAAQSDVRHVTVEFVHPVIVGKRALPAIGLAGTGDEVRTQLELLTRPDDIVFAFSGPTDPARDTLSAAIGRARARGCLTIAQSVAGADFAFEPSSPDGDPFVEQELTETLYHVLWELVHVFIEHATRNASTARDEDNAAHAAHASSFLYPFLAEAPTDRDALVRDAARSALIKSRDVDALRRATLDDAAIATLTTAASLARERLAAGACILAFGNGGSATDAMDLVADLRSPPPEAGLRERPALDLSIDSAILTALANDVGPDVVFARQMIAYARRGDIAVGFSTSGSSRNVIAAFAEARSRGMATLAFAGYDGGRILDEHLADYVVVAPSQHVPRIQEAHATAYHIWRTLVG